MDINEPIEDFNSEYNYPDIEKLDYELMPNHANGSIGTLDQQEQNYPGENAEEPMEITSLFRCPMCNKKYLTHSNVEKHISVFHKIPLNFQRQSLQGGISTAICQEIVH